VAAMVAMAPPKKTASAMIALVCRALYPARL
jgi:hypothetical protein